MKSTVKNIESLFKKIGRTTLLVVTKKRSPKEIREVIAAGVKHIGENTLQEIQKKYDLNLFRELQKNGVQLHYIGQLQRNKVNKITKLCDVIQSVESLELAEKINQAAAALNKVMPIFIQLNASGEAQKHGIRLESEVHEPRLRETIEHVKELKNLHLLGFMTIGKHGDAEATRRAFRRCRQLADQCGLQEVSMGMSEDYPIAIEEGATMVRVGSLLFEAAV